MNPAVSPIRAISSEVDERILVTQPPMGPLSEFILCLEGIYDSKVLTNRGPFRRQLGQALCEHLGVERLALFANGTLALVTALQSLRITGDVITTPYPFVAMAHSLLSNGIKAIFELVDKHYLRLLPFDPVANGAQAWRIAPPDDRSFGNVYDIKMWFLICARSTHTY